MDETAVVQYYVAEQGRHPDGALALLAARGALLGHARWHDRPGYAYWRDHVMTKVVLEARAEEVARVRATTETLALVAGGNEAAAGGPAALLVLPPQPKVVALPVLGHLRLVPKRRGQVPEPSSRPALVLVAAGDLGMHGGKLAAQAAHAALLAETAYAQQPAWSRWTAAGSPLALRRATSACLATLAARYPASAVHDGGQTQVAAGALTVVAVPPAASEGEWPLTELARW